MQGRFYYVSGFVTAFFITAVLLVLFKNANAKENNQPNILSDSTDSLKTIKTFLALGDSYTIGQSVDSSQRFPAQTAAILKSRGYNISNIDYIATTGWKTVNLQWAIEALRTKKTYDMVTLLIGVNDQYLKHDTARYREHFTNLMQKAVAFADGNPAHVFVLSLPDYGITPFGAHMKGVGRQIDQFNMINKQVTLQYRANYTNITGVSRNDAADSTFIAWDDMHPSGKQYGQWAQLLSGKIMSVME